MTKIIESDAEYRQALTRIEKLVDLDPRPGTPDGNELELLSFLIREYEDRLSPKGNPGPIEAIRFRMEQQSLTPRDLLPYIGSRSKVSEVLSGRRPLTLPMVRALHAGLGIPARVLIQEPPTSANTWAAIEWDRFPLKDMIAKAYFKEAAAAVMAKPQQFLEKFLAPLGSQLALAPLYKKTDHVRSGRTMDRYALMAWSARILNRALESPPPIGYKPNTITKDFMEEVARLSLFDNGPALAQEFLSKNGISLIIEPHLPKTHLDGAALLLKSNTPVIGMTVRHDRIDNFWFVLEHELTHVSRHLKEDAPQFFDDLDVESGGDPREEEADKLAGEALIPTEAWAKSPASRLRSPNAAEHLAKQLRIHPAIVAGRMRREFNAYRLLSHVVGHGQVRPCFPGLNWE